jgi:zinc/manganese transport system substrate-binding protein
MPAVFRCLAAFLALLAVRCVAEPLRITTLSTVLTEVAREVGGSEVRVTAVLAPGVDPHTFEPAPSDLEAITEADLVLASGLGLETYLDRIAANSNPRGRIAEAGLVLGKAVLAVETHGRPEPDPHWWHSIRAMITVTDWVAAELSELRPGSAAGFRARAAAYDSRLSALGAWTRRELAAVPLSRRTLVTTHNAFGWFARDYGFTVHPISGLSTEAEPDARDFAALARLIRAEKVPAIFRESDENSKLAAALARETGARLGEALYADGLVPDEDGATFEAMYRHNVRAIVDGLR